MSTGRARWPIRAFYTVNEVLSDFGIKMQNLGGHTKNPHEVILGYHIPRYADPTPGVPPLLSEGTPAAR